MSLHDFTVTDSDRNEVSLSKYKGHVVLVVNTASKCGFTKQLKDLQELYEKYKDKNFVVLAFPCGQFGDQEFEHQQDIIDFYVNNYNVKFPIMQKITMIYDGAIPLYKWIKSEAAEGEHAVSWNFTKFLFDKNGNYVRRFNHDEPPAVCETYIQALL